MLTDQIRPPLGSDIPISPGALLHPHVFSKQGFFIGPFSSITATLTTTHFGTRTVPPPGHQSPSMEMAQRSPSRSVHSTRPPRKAPHPLARNKSTSRGQGASPVLRKIQSLFAPQAARSPSRRRGQPTHREIRSAMGPSFFSEPARPCQIAVSPLAQRITTRFTPKTTATIPPP